MSFLVTARKWRPQTFAEVVGQEGVCRTLQNALKAGRIAHAYIFSGPRGIGKTTTARLLAKAVNCQEGPTADPCNQCLPCQEISEGRCLDVLEIDGASNRGVGEIRNLRENIRFNPVSCRKKIYIIDEVHMLTIEAFNALLKTLEEPPEHAIFIFATTEINRVPATILSRCQRFDFRRLSSAEIAAHLRHICNQENIKAEDEALQIIARRADGAMRDGQSLLDQMNTFAPDGIAADEVRLALGIIPEELFFRISDLMAQNQNQGISKLAEVLTITAEIDAKGYSPREFLRGLCEHFLNFMKAADQKTANFIEAASEVRLGYLERADQFQANDLLRILAILQNAFTEIRRHPQPRLKLELTLLRLASLERTAQIEDLLAGLRGMPSPTGKPGSSRTATPATQSARGTKGADAGSLQRAAAHSESGEVVRSVPQGDIPLDFNYIRAQWPNLVDRICTGRISLACQLKLGRPEKLEGDTLVVGFGSDFHDLQLARLKKVAASGSFDQGLQQTFDAPVRLRFERYSKFDAEKISSTTGVEDPVESNIIRILGAKRIG